MSAIAIVPEVLENFCKTVSGARSSREANSLTSACWTKLSGAMVDLATLPDVETTCVNQLTMIRVEELSYTDRGRATDDGDGRVKDDRRGCLQVGQPDRKQDTSGALSYLWSGDSDNGKATDGDLGEAHIASWYGAKCNCKEWCWDERWW